MFVWMKGWTKDNNRENKNKRKTKKEKLLAIDTIAESNDDGAKKDKKEKKIENTKQQKKENKAEIMQMAENSVYYGNSNVGSFFLCLPSGTAKRSEDANATSGAKKTKIIFLT